MAALQALAYAGLILINLDFPSPKEARPGIDVIDSPLH